jgi:hypothetical protein
MNYKKALERAGIFIGAFFIGWFIGWGIIFNMLLLLGGHVL